MTDFLSPTERSERMSRIRSKNTVPEVKLRSALHRLGFRFRLNGQKLPGRPDIILARYKAVVFVHGCFWHRHPGCKVASTPKSNTTFWVDKFNRNLARDEMVVSQLEELGWRVFVVWECSLSSTAKTDMVGQVLAMNIRSAESKA